MKQQKGCIAQKASANHKPLIPSNPKRSEYPLSPVFSNRSVSLGSRNSTRHFQSDLALFGNQVNLKRTQYFVDTENEMQEQRRKDLQAYQIAALNKHLAFTKDQRVKTLCYIFMKKLKRNNVKSIRFYNDLGDEKITHSVAQVVQEEKAPLSLLVEIGYTLTLLLVLVYYSLCLSFQRVLMARPFSIITTLITLSSLIKLCHTIISYRNIGKIQLSVFFKIKGFGIELAGPSILFILGIVLMLLYINNELNLIQYILLLVLLLLFLQIKKVLPQILVQTASFLRAYSLISSLDLITLAIENILWIQIFSVILSKMIVERSELNWASLGGQSYLNSSQIYLRSLFESINIILTASFGFPSPENRLQTYVFLPTRIVAFLISFINLQVIIKRILPILKKQKPQADFYHNLNFQRIIQRYSSDRIKYIQANELLQYFHDQHQRRSQSSSEDKLSTIYECSNSKIPMQEILTRSIVIFAGLSNNLCQQLAKICHVEILPTGMIITSLNSTSDWLILAKGKVSAVPMATWGLCEANFVDSKLNQGPVLLSCHLLSRKTPKWRLRCNTTSLIYRIFDEDFRKAITINDFDHELISSQHDKHSFQDEFSLFRCYRCNQSHSDFECPKLHYAPLVSTVVLRHRRPILFFLKRFKGHESRLLRIKSSALKYFGPFQQLVPEIKLKLLQHCNSKLFFQLVGSQRLQQRSNYLESTVIEKAAQKMLGRFRINLDDHQDQIWQLKTDELYNYKYYFPRHNPSNLTNQTFN